MIDTTITEDFLALGGGAAAERQALSRAELLARVSALMQSCEGCESVRVAGVMPLDRPDEKGCNWGLTLWLETAGVAPEVYGLAYAQVIGTARSSWNLQPEPAPSPAMRIWVDADACPAATKYVLFRAAERRKIALTLVANKPLRVPASPWIRALQVPRGIDVADSHIVREMAPGDLVVTADSPLAAGVIAKGGHVLNPDNADRKRFAEQLDRLLAKL